MIRRGSLPDVRGGLGSKILPGLFIALVMGVPGSLVDCEFRWSRERSSYTLGFLILTPISRKKTYLLPL